jgi:hypothetical protein
VSSKHRFDDVLAHQRIFQSIAQSCAASGEGNVQCLRCLRQFGVAVSVTESQPRHENAVGNHLAGKQSAQLKRGAAVSLGGEVIRVGGRARRFEVLRQTVFLCFAVEQLGEGVTVLPQVGNDLGACLKTAWWR